MDSNRNDIPQEFSEAIKRRVGKNLRRKRQEEGLSLRRFARNVGMNEIQSVWRWENGVNLPRLDMLMWICVRMGWNVSEILTSSKDVKTVPTVGVSEDVKPIDNGDDSYSCDRCGETVGWEELNVSGIDPVRYKYCPGCGRKVDWNG